MFRLPPHRLLPGDAEPSEVLVDRQRSQPVPAQQARLAVLQLLPVLEDPLVHIGHEFVEVGAALAADRRRLEEQADVALILDGRQVDALTSRLADAALALQRAAAELAVRQADSVAEVEEVAPATVTRPGRSVSRRLMALSSGSSLLGRVRRAAGGVPALGGEAGVPEEVPGVPSQQSPEQTPGSWRPRE